MLVIVQFTVSHKGSTVFLLTWISPLFCLDLNGCPHKYLVSLHLHLILELFCSQITTSEDLFLQIFEELDIWLSMKGTKCCNLSLTQQSGLAFPRHSIGVIL